MGLHTGIQELELWAHEEESWDKLMNLIVTL